MNRSRLLGAFFTTLPGNLIECVRGRKLVWYAAAVLLTGVLVWSGFDWWYFRMTDAPGWRVWMFPAAFIGFAVPIYLPILLGLAALIARSRRVGTAAVAVAQAELIGLILSSACKAFTGRAHPLPHGLEDLSRVFHFGFLRGGMFWGWPSSHTSVAFAMAVTVLTLFPKPRWPGLVALAYALYIGLGISMTIHWFSDFAAGTILGSVIGRVVGTSFLRTENAAAAPSPAEAEPKR